MSDPERDALALAAQPPSLPVLASSFNDIHDSTRTVARQFARYFAVGGVAFIADAGTLYLLTRYAGVYYLVSATIGFLLGLCINYVLSRFWVFDRRTLQSTALEFVIFSVIGIVGLGLNDAIIWFVYEQIHVHYLAAKIVSGGAVLIWNFGARKMILFR